MEEFNVYKDIQDRTHGEIYIGVVGPVRTGKSTFIKKFMDTVVIPHIPDGMERERAIDELPQSSAGRTIMTTEPKFIPEQAVDVQIDEDASFRVRMIDCVGYIVPSAIGYILRAALDEEETSRIDTEDGQTLIIIDVPAVDSIWLRRLAQRRSSPNIPPLDWSSPRMAVSVISLGRNMRRPKNG